MKETTLTPSKAAAEWLIDAMGDESLFGFLAPLGAATHPFFRGFKVSARNLAKRPVRTRLRNELCQNVELCSRFLAWPRAPWHAWHSGLQAVAEDWLVRHWRMLLRNPGGQAVAVAMALDSREPVYRRGRRMLTRERFWDARDEREDAVETPSGWGDLQQLISVRPAAAAGDLGSATPPEYRALLKRVQTLEKEEDALRLRLRKSRTQSKDAEADRQSASAGWENEKRELRRTLRETQRRCEQLAVRMDERVEARVREFRRNVLGLTDEVEHARRALRGSGSAALLRRSEDILVQQRRLNEKHGTLSALRAELAHLQTAETQLEECIAESLVVLPELNGVRRAVRERIEELQGLLPEPTQERPPDLVVDFSSRIKSAPLSADGAVRIEQIAAALEQPAVVESLGPSWVQRLRETLQRERRILAAVGDDPGSDISGRDEDLPAHNAPGEIWDVALELSAAGAAGPVWLFVDGYNVIKTVPELARIEEQQGLAGAREAFISLCRSKAAGFGQIEIVFDGADSVSARETVEGVTVVFSAQLRSSQNADRYIVDRLSAVSDDAPLLWLVTGDYGLRHDAKRLCAAFIAPSDFQHFLTR